MRSRDRLKAACVTCVIGLAACATNNAPPTFLPEPKQAGAETHGGWIELSVVTSGTRSRLVGELLAVTPESVWIATRRDSLRAADAGYVVARRAIAEGKVTWYNADPAGIALASVLGTASTISNGVFLIFSAPAWIITGSIAGAAYTREPVIQLVPDAGRDLRPFTRFPLGMPPGLDASFKRLGDTERSRPPSPSTP